MEEFHMVDEKGQAAAEPEDDLLESYPEEDRGEMAKLEGNPG